MKAPLLWLLAGDGFNQAIYLASTQVVLVNHAGFMQHAFTHWYIAVFRVQVQVWATHQQVWVGANL